MVKTRKCYVATCTNTYKKTKNVCIIDEKTCTLTTITYHSFPKDNDLRTKWIKATGRTDWTPTHGNSFICSEHFRECDFIIEQRTDNSDSLTQLRRSLRRNAIPTLHLTTDEDLNFDENYESKPKGLTRKLKPSPKDEKVKNEDFKPIILPIQIDEIKKEPEVEDDQNDLLTNSIHETPVSLTSAVTIKEENDCDKYNGVNGIFEAEVSSNETLDIRLRPDIAMEPDIKKFKLDQVIPPGDIKIEMSLSPNRDSSIEEKYELLLDQYLMLKRDYDIIKAKYERQKEALNECEQILKRCR